MNIRPSQVLAKEQLRKGPFSKMAGCCEFEKVIVAVVKHLAENGDRWDIPVNVEELNLRAWDLAHSHPDGRHCFQSEYMLDGKVNSRFVSIVTRDFDFQEFKDEVVARLIDWPIE